MFGEAFRGLRLSIVLACAGFSVAVSNTLAHDSTVSARSVLKFSFDEASGDAADTATVGAVKDVGVMANAASRVKSPFAGQKGKQALIVDAARKQFVQAADGADVDQGNGVSASFFYLHLGSPEDAAFQSLFAKRLEGAGTTYGINFNAKADTLQVYLNDGTGFKTAHYGVKQVLGFRRPNFITVTYEIGDAPGDDADQDKDDVLVRMYVNGQPQTPKAVPGVQITGNDSWLLNLNIPGLLNDAPLTIGASTPTIEFTSGVFDEFSLIPQALTPEDAAKLFKEVAGADALSAVLPETLPALGPAPTLSLLSTNGLQLGATSTLVIQGANLQPTPAVLIPIPGAQVSLGPNTNANQVEIQIVVPPETLVGHYPVRVLTPNGVSNALPVAVDALPEVAANLSSAEKPSALPVAVSGIISGAQQARAYFSGKAGQRIVADIESRRLGATMTPVIEVKSARGTPVKIEWGHVEFGGDTRADVKLPADGIYYVEVHDLSYNAPGVNPYRLKIGDLKLADVVMGGITSGTESQLALSGLGTDPQTKLPIDLKAFLTPAPRQWPLPASLGFVAPAPKLIVTSGPEFAETPAAAGQLQTLDAKFTTSPLAVGFMGSLAAARERDTILLSVTPGQKLTLTASGGAANSPVDPQLQVLKHPEGNVLASVENPGTRDATLEFTVPGDQQQIQLAVRDLRFRGGPSYRYRLQVAPAGQPNFSLTLSADRTQLAQDGSSALLLAVNRAGYNGPVNLTVQGDPQVTIAPAQIPAGVSQGWVTLKRRGAPAAANAALNLQISGQSTDITPGLTSLASLPPDARLALLANERTVLATGLTAAAGTTLELGALPATLFKGVDAAIPVKLTVNDQARTRIARLTLLTTEAARPNNPNDPNQGQKPRVDAAVNQTLDADDPHGSLLLTVPTDIAETSIDFVIKAELVEHQFAQNVVSTVYSVPFRLPIQNAGSVELAANSLTLKSATAAKFTGKFKRTAGFAGPVSVQILNLPAGSTVPAVTVPADQETFELTVTPPAATAPMDIPNVVFRVVAVDGGKPVQADTPLAAKIMP